MNIDETLEYECDVAMVWGMAIGIILGILVGVILSVVIFGACI